MIVPVKHLYSTIDRKPINKSKAHRILCRLIGKQAALKLTYKDY